MKEKLYNSNTSGSLRAIGIVTPIRIRIHTYIDLRIRGQVAAASATCCTGARYDLQRREDRCLDRDRKRSIANHESIAPPFSRRVASSFLLLLLFLLFLLIFILIPPILAVAYVYITDTTTCAFKCETYNRRKRQRAN